MRVVEIYAKGNFPKLVLEAKKEFASKYGLQSEYWRHFDVNESPEVLSYLKSNLKDLANHHHAQYQNAELVAEKPANYAEALRWYREYLVSFPKEADTPPINYQLADLLLENEAFGEAALEYERTAYDYPVHAKSAAAGYAAIFAHRQNLKTAPEELRTVARTNTVASSLRFADTFPTHEHAATVLGAAADDLYGMKDFRPAVAAAQKLIERYPGAEPGIRRSAWTVVAHSSLELAEYPQAEQAYVQVLALTPQDDAGRQALVDNLAASIYKQGEQANAAQDYRTAADHFLRVKQAAPTSQIRAAAEYDAAAALIQLQDWIAAAGVLEAFRSSYPDHELNREATKQIAYVYRQNGQLSQAAGEYERVATESSDPNLRGEALLVAGDLYEQSGSMPQALGAYTRYVEQFPRPIDTAVETRFKIAEMHQAAHDEPRYLQELQQIVRIDAQAGAERTNRTRTVAARSALVLVGAALSSVRGSAAPAAVRGEPRGEEAAHGCGGGGFRTAGRLRDRRRHRGRDVLHRGDVHRLQSRADGVRAPRRPARRGTEGIRAGARGRGVSVRGTGHRSPREEHGADAHRDLQRLDRQEPRQARRADAGSLREGRAFQRLPRFDRALRLCRAHRAPAARACSGGRGGGSAAA